MPERVIVEIVASPLPTIVAETFFAAAEKSMQLRVPMEEAVQILASEIDLNFVVEGRPSHWEPWSTSYAKRRRQAATRRIIQSGIAGAGSRMEFSVGTEAFQSALLAQFSSKILQLSGTLAEEAGNSANWIIEQSGTQTEAILYDPTGYGVFHVTGREGPSFMPIRDWTFISDEAIDAVTQEFLDWIEI